MRIRNSQKRGIAGLLAATVLAAAFTVYMSAAGAANPTLSFEGVEMNTMDDGSVQMLFTIYVSNLDRCSGTAFYLNYNPDYLTPSDQNTNAPFSNTGLSDEDGFFQPDTSLYPSNPYMEETWSKTYYSRVDTQQSYIAMDLKLKQNMKPAGKLRAIDVSYTEQAMVFDSLTEKVALGTLSFRVAPEYLPEIVRNFETIQESETPLVGENFLIQTQNRTESGNQFEAWQISYFVKSSSSSNLYKMQNYSKDNPGTSPNQAKCTFTFDFPETVISIEAAERNVVVDAYQAYTDGTAGDVAALLRKYSSVVTATYADGGRVNYVMPWGLPDETVPDGQIYAYTLSHYDASEKAPGAAVNTDYDCTGNAAVGKTPDYIAQQYYYYQSGKDQSGNPVYKRHPVPITATVAITPIQLTGVTAEGLEQTYALRDALLSDIKTVSGFKLPTKARLTTDIVPDGATLTMDIPGWKASNAASTWPVGSKLDTLIADEATSGASVPHWPTEDDVGKLDAAGKDNVIKDRLGTYSFETAASMGGATATPFTAAQVKAAYPWLTVSAGWSGSLKATRALVEPGKFTDAVGYVAEYVSTTTDTDYAQPVLTLQVAKGNGRPEQTMSTDSKFRVRLPDGTTVDSAWFADAASDHSGYSSSQVKLGVGDLTGFEISLKPGNTASGGAYDAQRELLHRFINLGGWFYVSLSESPDTNTWSDDIPVYVPPRSNLFTENAAYYFIGDNRGLFRYRGGTLGTNVVLPRGEFVPLDSDGTYHYKNSDGKPTYITANGTETWDPSTGGVKNRLKTDRYGITTTYDGTTGAAGGRLYGFSVDSWTKTTGQTATIHSIYYSDITQYGANPFLSPSVYAAYGAVLNAENHTATMSFHEPTVAVPAQTESITLTGTDASLSIGVDDNVALVTYDTQKEGYTARQEVTLTITNTGSTPIYGMDIDTTTDSAANSGDGKGNFRMLRPPAAFLAPGQSTTFTLTYQFDLRHRIADPLDYIDTLFITSRDHGTPDDCLLQFDAKFRVSNTDVHRVTVQYVPGDGAMGTAGTIVGEVNNGTSSAPVYAMDYAAGSYTFTDGEKVYIATLPDDEYGVKSITYTYPGQTGSTTPEQYKSGDGTATAELRENTGVYYFTMPQDDVVVLVEYEESIFSKLRLQDIVAFATPAESETDAKDKLKPKESDPPKYQVYQKAFTAQEGINADEFVKKSQTNPDDPTTAKRTADEYLMQVGRAVSDEFDSKNNQYLVVIPADANWSQIEVTLRKVNTAITGNSDITPNITMELLGTDPTDISKKVVMSPDPQNPGDTSKPSVHASDPFESPQKGASAYVRIQLSYRPDGAAETIYRYYFVEIHRMDDTIDAGLNYGNSPYGMILNATNIPFKDPTDATAPDLKAEALAKFVANRYSFAGLDAKYIPTAVTDAGLENVHYWSEAWSAQGSVYEPESETGTGNTAVYDVVNNLDLNPSALFVRMTEGFYEPGISYIKDNSGRAVDASEVSRYVDVMLLDSTKTTQVDRFAEPAVDDPVRTAWRVPLGKADAPNLGDNWAETALLHATDPVTRALLKDADGNQLYVQAVDATTGTPQVDAEGNPVYKTIAIQDIRPDVYDLVYAFTDFDGTTTVNSVKRPLIILGPTGDVNGNGKVDSRKAPLTSADLSDEDDILNRVMDPLGYTATGYTWANVFRYRQCDVNNDRNINNIDANTLRAGTTDLLRFYLSTGYIK